MFSIQRAAAAIARQKVRTRVSQTGSNLTSLTLGCQTDLRYYARRAALPVMEPRTSSKTPLSQPRTRSFLLDKPSKPASLRASPSRELPKDASPFERRLASNPYASILATPVRQCLYTRRSLPNAFLTKLIQAASDASSEKVWIVPEGIIPQRITRSSSSGQASNRFGIGKWVYSGSKITERMVKEGKYKMINASAYIRPDLAQLVYAQWTIRVASDLLDLCMARLGPSPVALLKNEALVLEKGSSVQSEDVRLTLSGSTMKKKLQCVLYFRPPRSSTDAGTDDPESVDVNSNFQSHRDEPLVVDITQPSLPTLMDRSRVLGLVKIHSGEKNAFTVPMYDMEQLFYNHPDGLRAIQQTCTRRLFVATPKDQTVDRNPCWIGLAESPSSVPAAMGLWKLASMLPKSAPSP